MNCISDKKIQCENVDADDHTGEKPCSRAELDLAMGLSGKDGEVMGDTATEAGETNQDRHST